MYILGYSGLDNAIEFRKNNLPDLTEQECRICQGMDSAAALLHNGKVIAAASEERFVGITHTGQFPKQAIDYCLKQAGITAKDLNAICHSFNYEPLKEVFNLDPYSEETYKQVYDPVIQKNLFRTHFNIDNIDSLFTSVRHHDAHAASAYFMSGLQNALVLVVDGMGEIDSISIYHAQNNHLEPLYRYDMANSLGIFYLIFTMHLGFEPNHDEYKVMGLAAYGNPDRFKFFFESCVEHLHEGKLNIPIFGKNKTALDKQTYRGLRDWLSTTLTPARKPSEPIKQVHKDIAAGLQQILNESLLHVLMYWQKKVPSRNLCMAGGVALNCVANGIVAKKDLFNRIFIQPAAGDDGTALGAALYKYHVLDNKSFSGVDKNELPFYGPEFTNEEILDELNKHKQQITYTYLEEDELIDQAAQLINAQHVIAWMQGRMEFGPRALGNRSILADPRGAGVKDRVNKAVKKREEFRPFAPSITAESAHLYFDIPKNQEFPYMLFAVEVKDAYRSQLPAITHIDGSARLQTVAEDKHPLYWKLLKQYEKYSGFPILLNTSFNIKGQPIVCTPADAVNTLLSTEMDVLCIGNFIVRKISE